MGREHTGDESVLLSSETVSNLPREKVRTWAQPNVEVLTTSELPAVEWLQQDFPGGPVVKTLPSKEGVWMPGWGAKIPHALWPKNQTQNRSKAVRNSIKIFKIVPSKKSLKKMVKIVILCYIYFTTIKKKESWPNPGWAWELGGGWKPSTNSLTSKVALLLNTSLWVSSTGGSVTELWSPCLQPFAQTTHHHSTSGSTISNNNNKQKHPIPASMIR